MRTVVGPAHSSVDILSSGVAPQNELSIHDQN
jgi:hypothetical protein